MVKMHRTNITCTLLFAIVLYLLQGCASEQAAKRTAPELPVSSRNEVTGRLVDHFQEWDAVPYRMGGLDKNGIDCSGFIQVTYRQVFDVQLPRTTEKLARVGSQVVASELQPGDLILFKTDWKDNHVGIYLENKTFMHASSTRGVMLSGLDEAYWKEHFWQARRIFD